MKTTLWTHDEADRARPLLQALEADVAEALAIMDEAAAHAAVCRAAFERARPKRAAPLWIELVYASDTLEDALQNLARLVREAAALNGGIDYERGGKVRLAGQDDEGRLVYWTLAGDALEAHAVYELSLDLVSTAA